MENSETKKQFRVTLFEDEILITTPSNNKEAFEAKINISKDLKIGSRESDFWHDWVETGYSALNYTECCGILILFGIEPPSFSHIYNLLTSES